METLVLFCNKWVTLDYMNWVLPEYNRNDLEQITEVIEVEPGSFVV